MPWNDGLEGIFLRIAETSHSPLLVVGGPGTRKTSSIIRRVGRFLELEPGQNPRRILVVTFTRTAAHDLIKQLRELNILGCDNVCASTLHSFCFSMLSRREILSFTGRVPRPLLKYEENFLVHDLPNRFGSIRERRKRLRAFETDWAVLQSDEPGWPSDPTDRDFHRELMNWLQFHKAILIGELIPLTLSYLRNNPACNERNAFDHVIVDEYQDLNKAEQVLVELISQSGTFTIAGDCDQSIYRFKYAHPDGIIEFQNHPETQTERLSQSFRCPTNVIHIANSLISNNNRPDPSFLIQPYPGSPPGTIHILQWVSIEEEAQSLAEIINHFITNRIVDPGSTLVLTPRRVIGYAIRDKLRDLSLDAHSFFHEEAFDSKKAQESFSLLTLLGNTNDRAAIRCWLGFSSPSLREGAYSRLRYYCFQNNIEPWNALENLESGNITIPYTGELVNKFQQLKQRLTELRTMNLNSLINELFPEDDPDAELIRELALEILGSCIDVLQLREQLRTRITQPELPSNGEFIRVMSLHKAKGLTADFVIVAGCIEGFIPTLDRDLSGVERQLQIEEQRRLFLVSITRTTNFLIISSFTEIDAAAAYKMGARIRHFSRDRGRTISSRFLRELGHSAPQPIQGRTFLEQLSSQ